ncbi:MAG: hypothetical protein B7Z55_18775, partial [Planctomycetales bacterium 12-60-4]
MLASQTKTPLLRSPVASSTPSGLNSIAVTPTPADYTAWTVSGQPAWLTLAITGNTITWTAAPNPSINPRSATFTIADKSFSLTQAGATGTV